VTVDWSINIGQIITIIGMVFAMISAYYILKSDVRALDARISVLELMVRDQIGMNAKVLAEVGAVRQDVAVLRDRSGPPDVSPQSPSKGS
jgi:hypothetical protein